METKAQLESELKKTYREVETVQDIKPRGMEMDSEDDTKKTILLMPWFRRSPMILQENSVRKKQGITSSTFIITGK